MLIGIDGACKKNGTPECTSVGCAWIIEESNNMLLKTRFEGRGSTSQRGEIGGLLEALLYAKDHVVTNEFVIIVTDSEYLFNTIEKRWLFKWHDNSWIGNEGTTIKNDDLWKKVYEAIQGLDVYMQWTKGHLAKITPSAIKSLMAEDPSGVALFSSIVAITTRMSEADRIIADFKRLRTEKGFINPPSTDCLNWVQLNIMADALGTYLSSMLDEYAW